MLMIIIMIIDIMINIVIMIIIMVTNKFVLIFKIKMKNKI